MTLQRGPMLSQAVRVVAHAGVSLNTGIDTIRALSFAAQATGRRHGGAVSPEASNMSQLPALADALDAMLGRRVDIVSGGNSANLAWAFDAADTGRINDLRLGESILLCRGPLGRRPIDGLHCDAITLVAEVTGSNVKPSRPWGTIAETAFGALPRGEQRPARRDLRPRTAGGRRRDSVPARLQRPCSAP